MDVNQTHENIVNFLKEKGPSLPVNIAKELGMSSLFISAFLSELSNEKRIIMSNLKVGGSPLYFIQGQEEKLEEYHKFMHPKESEAFLLLKKNKLLKDEEQDPAIRVALRSIKDFAIGFEFEDKIYWKYILVPESEIEELINPPSIKSEKLEKESQQEEKTQSKEIKKEDNKTTKPKTLEKKPANKKSPSDFALKVTELIRRMGLDIIEEKGHKAKEYNCILQIKSELGDINFLTQAKDKKTISETDLMKLLSEAKHNSLPAFILYTGEISKKAKEYLKEYNSILKAKKIA